MAAALQQLDTEQAAYAHATTSNNVVCGCPGSGKTTALVARVRHRVATGLPLCSQLVLTFFKATQTNLTARLADVFGDSTSRCVRTVHSVCWDIMRGCETEPNDLATLISRALRTGVIGEWFTGVRDVYVDEAQVLNRSMMEFVDAIRRDCPWVSVDLLGDPAQNIWTRVRDARDEFMARYAGSRYQLRTNYRSSPQIVAFCESQRPAGAEAQMVATAEDGDTPTLFVGDRQQQLRRLLDALRATPPGQTAAVLCANRHGTGRLPAHLCCQDIVNYLETASPPVRYVACFDETKSRGEAGCPAWTVAAHADPDTVTVSTIHGALGREFDHVHVVAYHFRADKRVPTLEDHYHHQKLFHVAASRARRSLALYSAPSMHVFPLRAPPLERVGRPVKELPTPVALDSCRREGSHDTPPVPWGSLAAHLEEARLMRVNDLYARAHAGLGSVFEPPGGELVEHDELATLYGTFAETVVCAALGTAPQVTALRQLLHDVVVVPPGGAAAHLQTARTNAGLLDASDVRRLRGRWAARRRRDDKWRRVLDELLCIETACDGVGPTARVYVQTDGRWFERDRLVEWAAAAPAPDALWMVSLFWYQFENDAAFRMRRCYDAHLRALEPYVRAWTRYGTTLSGAAVQVRCAVSCPGYETARVLGCADLVHENTVIELKLARRGLSPIHRVQALGYTQFLQVETPVRLRTRLVNLYTGETEDLCQQPAVSTEALFAALFDTAAEPPRAPRLQIDPSAD